jgi:hypothetical protein
MAQGSVTFELIEAEAVAASRHVVARRVPIRPNLLVACALAAGVLGLFVTRGASEGQFLRVLVLLVMSLAVVLALTFNVFIPWQARNHFRQLAAAKGTTTFSWDEAGAGLAGQKGEARFFWGDFYRWSETDALLILYQSSMLYNIVPKHALQAAQLEDIVALLTANGVKRV